MNGLSDTAGPARVLTGVSQPGKTVLVFGGQGSQWVGMGAQLLASSEPFAQQLTECSQALAPHLDFSVLDLVRDGGALDRVDVVQPVLFAVMVSLAAVWRAAGVLPEAVVGHSQGEVAAACVAGALSLPHAARIVALRSRLLRALSGQGTMASIALASGEVEELIGGVSGLRIAAYNGPVSTVVSGPTQTLADLVAGCEARGVRARLIAVDYASHHPDVEPIRDELSAALADIRPQQSTAAVYSTVSGTRIEGTGMDAGYWFANVRQPVLFHQAVQALLADGYRHFIEVSPHPLLTMSIQDAIDAAGVTAAATDTTRRDDDTQPRLWAALAQAWTHGVPINWRHLLDAPTTPALPLPTYPFQHQRYWLEAADRRTPLPLAQVQADIQFWNAVEQHDLSTLSDLLDAEPEVLAGSVSLLANWRRDGQDRSSVDSWRYRSTWQPVDNQPPVLRGRWLVFVPAGYTEDQAVVACLAGMSSDGLEVSSFVVATESATRTALSTYLREVAASTAEPVGVVSMLALDEGTHPVSSSAPRGLVATIALIQALGDEDVAAPLWCVTRGAVSTGRSDALTVPVQAQLWGLGRVACVEIPERWGGIVDLPTQVGKRAASLFVAALHTPVGEDELAVRPSGLLVRRLTRAEPARPAGPCPVDVDGTVLITGGTGALAGHVARWLASAGARHLLLVSRSGPDSKAVPALRDDLAALGADVDVVAGDISDRAALAAVLDAIPAEYPLTAVFHAAGALDDGLLDGLTVERLDGVLSPKATAARHLHELTATMRLSAFVLFSSMAGAIGNPGQAAYAAANAYLDALAQHRADHGLPATSIAWGRWAGHGMGADSGSVDRQLDRRGFSAMEPRLATLALAQALENDESSLLIGAIRWERFLPVMKATRASRLFDGIPEAEAARPATTGPGQPAEDGSVALRERLSQLWGRDREQFLSGLVQTRVASLLGYRDQVAAEPHRPFRDIGFDSVLAVEFRNLLNQATGLVLPASLVFDYPTPAEVAAYLSSRFDNRPSEATDDMLAQLDAIKRSLRAAPSDEVRQRELATSLRSVLAVLEGPDGDSANTAVELDTATDEGIIQFINDEFGIA
jgi:acyl transferase domain-containing protein